LCSLFVLGAFLTVQLSPRQNNFMTSVVKIDRPEPVLITIS
jgi:hypothetical protein